MDPVDSRQVPRDWRYSGIPPAASRFRLQGYHLLWPGFPAGSTIATHHRRTSVIVPAAPTTPDMQRSRAYTCQVWALPFSLAATRGVEVSFLSCRYLDGSVPCVPYDTLWIHVPLMEGYSMPFPDLGDPRINACLRLPEDYRSLATSFIGSWCQGIPTCTRGSLTFLFARDRFTRISLSLTPACQRPCPRTVPWDVRERRSRRVTHLVPSPLAPRQRRSCRAHGHSTPTLRDTRPTRLHDFLDCITGLETIAPESAAPHWRRPVSNRRPSGCKPDALPAELRPRSASERRFNSPLGDECRPEWTRTTDLTLIRRTL